MAAVTASLISLMQRYTLLLSVFSVAMHMYGCTTIIQTRKQHLTHYCVELSEPTCTSNPCFTQTEATLLCTPIKAFFISKLC